MTAIPNADERENDRFGYSCYAIVLPAQDEIKAICDQIEHAAGMTRAKIPAHVTVKGTFYTIDSLEEVKRCIQNITDPTAPFTVPLADAQPVWWGEKGGALTIPVTPPLQVLHDQLVAEITPLGQAAYQDDPYHPHMTFVQDVTPEGLAIAQKLVAEADFGPHLRADSIDLMARVGRAHGGKWTRLIRFPLLG
ncbi:MAG: 2'-5' RNA ligase family protein [Litorilinea sp.]